jgi:hypothetical protein
VQALFLRGDGSRDQKNALDAAGCIISVLDNTKKTYEEHAEALRVDEKGSKKSSDSVMQIFEMFLESLIPSLTLV